MKRNILDNRPEVEEMEKRRIDLGVSKRKLSREAGLQQDYYPHLVAGQFRSATGPKERALLAALDRLERIDRLHKRLKNEAEI